MDAEQLSHLKEAQHCLHEIVSRDCDCHWSSGVPTEDNACEVCQAKRAMLAIGKAVTPPLEGMHPNRMTGLGERVYVEKWRAENDRDRDGVYLLRRLLSTNENKLIDVTHRDAQVATTIIQWLGTNCGRGFVRDCQFEIEKQVASVGGVVTDYGSPGRIQTHTIPLDDKRRAVAEMIAKAYISIDLHPAAVRALESAILAAIVEFSEKATK